MKKIIYFAAFLLSIIGLQSCEQHEIAFYDGQDAIFFDQQYGVAWFDTLRQSHQIYSLIPFGMMANSDSLLRIKVETTGYLRDYDRPFKIEIVADSTTAREGEEFDAFSLEGVIRAGQNSTYIPIHFHKTERLLDETLQLQIRLIPGEHFTLPFGENGIGVMPKRNTSGQVYTELSTNFDCSIHNIFMHTKLKQPKGWNTVQFGKYYSSKKYSLILDIAQENFGWDVTYFDPDTDNKMLLKRSTVLAPLVAKYLMEQFNKGREYWVIDEDGSMMWVLGVTWAEGADPSKFE